MRLLAIVVGCVCLERGSVGMAGQPSALLIVLGLALVLRGLYPHAGRSSNWDQGCSCSFSGPPQGRSAPNIALLNAIRDGSAPSARMRSSAWRASSALAASCWRWAASARCAA
jgi:hypothetical protein